MARSQVCLRPWLSELSRCLHRVTEVGVVAGGKPTQALFSGEGRMWTTATSILPLSSKPYVLSCQMRALFGCRRNSGSQKVLKEQARPSESGFEGISRVTTSGPHSHVVLDFEGFMARGGRPYDGHQAKCRLRRREMVSAWSACALSRLGGGVVICGCMTHSPPLSPHTARPRPLSPPQTRPVEAAAALSSSPLHRHFHLDLTLTFTTAPSTEDATPLALSGDALHIHTPSRIHSETSLSLSLSGPSPHFSSRRRRRPKSTAKPRATSREHSTHIHQDQGMRCYSPTIMAFPRYSNLPKIEKSGDVVGTVRRV
ncbi:hypothetical protein COCVIDRAFT_17777 [Bipolaris victoriae FI3]|uniref:Uncharacterized protein n=1 Tax=Bipolaris victoriae (strain FI3) TaxID=930091 RepID=W7ED73_BIPV3|nr:hypothetical protein COCVIDRAFT_17777 [Bipolaris victoriae FI3]